MVKQLIKNYAGNIHIVIMQEGFQYAIVISAELFVQRPWEQTISFDWGEYNSYT
jgi:hypothetical protein